MFRDQLSRIVVTCLALVVVTSLVAGSVGATPGDDGGIDVGGDDGVSVGADGVSVGGDDGVEVGTDGIEVGNSSLEDGENPVSQDDGGIDVGGDDGVSVGTDGVSVGGDDGVNVDLGDGGELPTDDLPGDGDLPGDSDLPDIGDDEAPLPENGSLPGVGDGDLPGDELPGLGEGVPDPGEGDAPDLGELGGLVDGENGSVDTGVVPVLETLGPVLEQAPTDELSREFDEEDLPVGTEDVLGPVPFEAVPADPQDLPVGSESAVGCSFPVRGDDLPLDAVPGPSQLPVQPNVPGVPTSLLTPEAVGGIVLGIPPEPCTAYDPDNPSLDPTDPPTDLDFDRQNFASEASGDRIAWVDEYNAETEQGQDGQLYWSFLLSEDEVVATEDLTISDGRTDDYLGLESRLASDRDFSNSTASVKVYLLGSGIGANLECADPVSNKSLDPDRLQEGKLECEATPDGLLQPPLGPEEIADTIQDPPISDEPPIDLGEVPIPISDIINL